MKPGSRLLICIVIALSAGCKGLFEQSTSTPAPTTVTAQLMNGSWASVSSTTTLANTCTDFRWTITEISGTAGSGTFTAKCMGTMVVTGMASGTLSGTTVTWTASGAGNSGATGTCAFSLSGTATFDGTQFRIPYTGTTCLGPVSGAEILRKS